MPVNKSVEMGNYEGAVDDMINSIKLQQIDADKYKGGRTSLSEKIDLQYALNYFSAKAGLLILLFGIYGTYLGDYVNNLFEYDILIYVKIFDFSFNISRNFLILSILFILSITAILIDFKSRAKLKEKNEFKVGNAVPIITRGILGTLFFAAGIFILLKGILVIFLSFGKPSEITSAPPVEEKQLHYVPSPLSPPEPPAPPITPTKTQLAVK